MTTTEVAFFICLTAGLVAMVLFLLRKTGWRRLVKAYATSNPPTGQIIQGQTVKIGTVTYKSCVTVGIAGGGLYLTISGKIVLIPWLEFMGIRETKRQGQKVPVLTVGDPRITRITVPNDLFEMMRAHLVA